LTPLAEHILTVISPPPLRQAYAQGDTETARELSGKLDPTKITAEDIKKAFGPGAPSARGS